MREYGESIESINPNNERENAMQTVKTLSDLLRDVPNDMPIVIDINGIRYEMSAIITRENGQIVFSEQMRYGADGITLEPVIYTKGNWDITLPDGEVIKEGTRAECEDFIKRADLTVLEVDERFCYFAVDKPIWSNS